ncbi:hypothetical protein KQX54_019534 [Cotesia glomerata]|uniref:Uncharacterized protein n=1 Tax=Cotesia glomerata TaxID=32391 RepID=A0AAV7J0A9_COTGL|nr:hypothetical protein KQX54_019534 [Cotesia glomerata]
MITVSLMRSTNHSGKTNRVGHSEQRPQQVPSPRKLIVAWIVVDVGHAWVCSNPSQFTGCRDESDDTTIQLSRFG